MNKFKEIRRRMLRQMVFSFFVMGILPLTIPSRANASEAMLLADAGKTTVNHARKVCPERILIIEAFENE